MPDEKLLSILKKIPGWTGQNATITSLSGGITNQNFRVDIDDASYVIRTFGKKTHYLGIIRENEYACSKIVAELGIGPAVIHFLPEEGFLATKFIDAKAVSTENACQPKILKRIVKSIKHYHDGPHFPGQFSPFQTVRNYYRHSIKKQVSFPGTLPMVFELMSRIENAVTKVQNITSCHNDLLAANFLDDGTRIWILDWEYAAMGDPFFDLGNFSVNQELNEDQMNLLLNYYFGETKSIDVAHLQLMRLVSDIREAFWGFLQSGISTLDFDYLDYANKHLDRFLINAESPEFGLWIKELNDNEKGI